MPLYLLLLPTCLRVLSIIYASNYQKCSYNQMYKRSEQEEQEERKIKNMYEWLHAGKATFPKVAIEIESPGRRNVVSTKFIKRGQLIIYIPKEQIISLETIKSSPTIQGILKHKLKLHSPKHCLLAIYLLEQKQDPSSPFKAYIHTLPTDCTNFPIFYSEEEMKQLKGSPLFEAVQQRRFEIEQDYKSLMQKDVGFKMTYDDFCWARMVICSRIFGVVMGEQKTDALVPMADMLNHGVVKQTIWSYSNSKQGFVIESLQNIPKGVQIFDSYGRKSNSRFLLNYGFVIDGNQSDQIQIKLRIDRKLKNKLQEVCEEDPCKFVFKLGVQFDYTCFQELISTVRFVLDVQAPQQLAFEEPTNKTTFRQPAGSFTSCQSQLKCWKYMKNLFKEMLEQYPTTLEQDKQILQRQQNHLSFNRANCIKLRMGQKSILKYYIDICEKMQELFSMSAKSFKKSWKKKTYKHCEEYLHKINTLLP